MSRRLQVLIPEELDRRLRRAAARGRISRGEWVRRAMEEALRTDGSAGDALARLGALNAPTADIDEMLREIEAGRK